MSKTVKQIIGDARDVLTSKGWVKGVMVDGVTGQSFCARGALALAGGAEIRQYEVRKKDQETGYYLHNGCDYVKEPRFALDEPEVYDEMGHKTTYGVAAELVDAAAREVAEARGHEDASGFCSVIDLNDIPGSTLEDVLSAFDRAYFRADRLEQESTETVEERDAVPADPTPVLVAAEPF